MPLERTPRGGAEQLWRVRSRMYQGNAIFPSRVDYRSKFDEIWVFVHYLTQSKFTCKIRVNLINLLISDICGIIYSHLQYFIYMLTSCIWNNYVTYVCEPKTIWMISILWVSFTSMKKDKFQAKHKQTNNKTSQQRDAAGWNCTRWRESNASADRRLRSRGTSLSADVVAVAVRPAA